MYDTEEEAEAAAKAAASAPKTDAACDQGFVDVTAALVPQTGTDSITGGWVKFVLPDSRAGGVVVVCEPPKSFKPHGTGDLGEHAEWLLNGFAVVVKRMPGNDPYTSCFVISPGAKMRAGDTHLAVRPVSDKRRLMVSQIVWSSEKKGAPQAAGWG